MKDPRMKGVEQGQPGFSMLKKGAARKSENRSRVKKHKSGRKRGSRY